MASKSGQRVRLVKCPKCLKILQEDEDVPVYQCGGCSAILQAKRRNIAPKPTPSAGETEGDKASEPPNTVTSAEETERAQASDHPNIAPSAGDSERAQESEPPNTGPSAGETEEAQASEPPIEGEREGTQASEPPIEPETNNVSSSAGQDTVLPLPTGHSSCQEDEKAGGGSMDSTEKKIGGLALSQREETNEIQLHEDSDKNEVEDNSSRFKSDIESVVEATRSGTSSGQDTVLQLHTGCSSVQEDDKDQDGSMESTEKQLGGLELSKGDESNERSLGDSDKNEGGDNSNSIRLKTDTESMVEATQPGTSSGSLDADNAVDARASSSSSDAYRKLEVEISPNASPVEEEQDVFQPHRESTDDLPANKTSSAYDGSKSSSDEREDQDENQQWNALQNSFERQRYPQNFKEQGGSSSSTFSDRRPSETTTYNKQYQNRSLQLEGPGGRLGRQGRRHVSEQLRPDVPLYPREPYSHVSPPYPPHDVFDSYSRLYSLQMPPYAGTMNYEGVDRMYHNNTRARDRGQGSWYSGQMYSSYSSYSASPQRLMEQQPEYYPRYSHEIVSDAEDHQRNRHADLQPRRRQPVAKRHIRPTAGGAPFVICYRCSQNLQLPVDFLIFKRKYHLLRCGKCTTVLRFSLQSRTHLVPAATHDIDANRTSNSTSESPRDKAEKPTSSAAQEEEEKEEIPVARGGSPLHRLMGYSTVSQVFKASQRPPSV